LEVAPNNASGWNYLRGSVPPIIPFWYSSNSKVTNRVLDHFKRPYADHLEWARSVKSPAEPERPIMLATEFVADALSETKVKENLEHAIKLYEQLGEEIDPMRENYWNFKKREAEALITA
jgi:hypothetical protein